MKNMEQAIFGGGCFWCVEAVMQRLEGVKSVVSGYAGGDTVDPTYRSISSGTTGHAEVVQVNYDASVISYEDLVTIFMTSHDPTTLNRQGADRGPQYRSIILYKDEQQKIVAEKVLQSLASTFPDTIVTELNRLEVFYSAEKYHQDYYNRNSFAGYCRVVIDPKISKLKQSYAHLLRKEEV